MFRVSIRTKPVGYEWLALYYEYRTRRDRQLQQQFTAQISYCCLLWQRGESVSRTVLIFNLLLHSSITIAEFCAYTVVPSWLHMEDYLIM